MKYLCELTFFQSFDFKLLENRKMSIEYQIKTSSFKRQLIYARNLIIFQKKNLICKLFQ